MKVQKVVPLVAALTLLWGTNWVLFPVAVQEVSVWTFRSICLLGAGLTLMLIARLRGISLHVPTQHRVRLVAAAFLYLVVWNVGSTYAAVYIPSGQAALLAFTMPIWTTLLSWLVLQQTPNRRMLVSLTFACAGVGLLLSNTRGVSDNAIAGFLLGLSAAIGWAAGTIVLKQSKMEVPPLVSSAWQLTIAGMPITFAAVWFAQSQPWFLPRWETVASIGYITFVPMAIGNVVWFSIVAKVPPVVSGLSTILIPVIAMLTGAVFRDEPLGSVELCAMGLCASSLAIALLGKQSVRQQQSAE